LQSQDQNTYRIGGVVVKNKGKIRPLVPFAIHTKASTLLDDPEIDTIVEAIDDSEAAFEIAKYALLSGKNVISANKKMIATYLRDLIALQQQAQGRLKYEASVAGSIPIIQLLNGYLAQEPVELLRGILNGTSNFILTKIFNDSMDYQRALRQAQKLGFAESDPSSDVSGRDTWYKTKILLHEAYGLEISLDQIFYYGIDTLGSDDIQYAKSKGKRIKLIAHIIQKSGSIAAWVMPQFVDASDPLFHIDNEYNSIEIESSNLGKQHFTGKGAGALPTAVALHGDLTSLNREKPIARALSYQALSPEEIKLEVYIRDKQILDRSIIPFIKVREGYLDDRFHYLIGEVRLSDLLNLKSWLSSRSCGVIATGRYHVNEAAQLKSVKRVEMELAL
jgi:homoserine dehydrogenase